MTNSTTSRDLKVAFFWVRFGRKKRKKVVKDKKEDEKKAQSSL